MPSFGLYSGPEVVINFAGIPLDDMRADEFVRVAPNEDSFGTIVGSDGSVTRFETKNVLFNVTFTFKRSSKNNALLSAVYIADRTIGGGAGVATMIVKDLNGSTLAASEKCWLKALPEWGSGKEVGPDVAWNAQAIILPGQMIVGGNQL